MNGVRIDAQVKSHSQRLERALSAILTIATALIALLLLTERFWPGESQPAQPQPGKRRVEYVGTWRADVASTGVALADVARDAKVAVFTDFQCPFCRRMDSVLTELEDKHHGKISRTVVHFPLGGHQFARAAATAFECASAQAQALRMHRVLYVGQERFGLTPWGSLAAEAGVGDTAMFGKCLKEDPGAQRIAAGVALGRRLGISGTPAVLLNGWLFDPAIPEDIVRAVEAVLRGDSPKQ